MLQYKGIMKELLDKLIADDWYGVSKEVEIAKGKNEMVTNFKEGFYKIKRAWRKSE